MKIFDTKTQNLNLWLSGGTSAENHHVTLSDLYYSAVRRVPKFNPKYGHRAQRLVTDAEVTRANIQRIYLPSDVFNKHQILMRLIGSSWVGSVGYRSLGSMELLQFSANG